MAEFSGVMASVNARGFEDFHKQELEHDPAVSRRKSRELSSLL